MIAIKFKAISAAYDQLKDDGTRRALRAEILGDYGNEAWKRQREAALNQDVYKNFQDAEAKMGMKGKMKGMYTFETLVHPRMLFLVLPAVLFAYYSIKSIILGDAGGVEEVPDMVDAWFNPRTGRFETPAPWDEQFPGAQALQKVKRSAVFMSAPPK